MVAPAAKPLEVFTVADAPAVAETRSGSLAVRLWERQGIPQSHQESSAPQEGTLPAVGVFLPRPGGWEDLRDRYQDAVINAVRAGPRVESKARELQGDTGEQTARNFYRMVTTRLRAGAGGWENLDIASAEDTLAGYSGSRTAVLLALARAAGLDARLLLARELDFARPQSAGRNAYTHPLVWFRFGPKDQVADAESQGLAFGVLPATLAHGDALLVPVTDSGTVPAGPQKPSESTSAALIVPVPPSVGDEHSVAEGDVTFDRQGNLSAQVTIRMGAARSAQMRAVLRGVEPEERRHFLEQVAMRIFPGAVGAEGGIRNENDPEQALELQFRCRAPRFLAVHGHSTALDQLAPILGLRKMYAVEARRLPLYIDMPLIETADFRVHLPAGFAVTALPVDLRTETEFGSYSLEFHQPSRSEIDIRRAFRIPVQLVAPDRFPEFSRFERQIDDAERQQISLAIE